MIFLHCTLHTVSFYKALWTIGHNFRAIGVRNLAAKLCADILSNFTVIALQEYPLGTNKYGYGHLKLFV